MKNRFKVIALPTEKATNILLKNGKPTFYADKIGVYTDVTPYERVCLHIVEPKATIEVGDFWYKPTGKMNIGQCSDAPFNNPKWLNSDDCKDVVKIIASTDSSLGIPVIDNEYFLQAIVAYGVNDVEIIDVQINPHFNTCEIGWKKITQFVEHNLRVPSYENNREKEFPTTREQALAWWRALDYDTKFHWFAEYCNRYTRNLEQIYDSEIEEIWLRKTSHIDPSDIEAVYEPQIKNLYKYRNLPMTASKEQWCVEGVDTYGGAGVLEWCYDQLDAMERIEIMSKYSQFESLRISCLQPVKEKPQVDFEMLKGTIKVIAECNWHYLESYELINLALFFDCMKNPSFAHKASKWLQQNS